MSCLFLTHKLYLPPLSLPPKSLSPLSPHTIHHPATLWMWNCVFVFWWPSHFPRVLRLHFRKAIRTSSQCHHIAICQLTALTWRRSSGSWRHRGRYPWKCSEINKCTFTECLAHVAELSLFLRSHMSFLPPQNLHLRDLHTCPPFLSFLHLQVRKVFCDTSTSSFPQ